MATFKLDIQKEFGRFQHRLAPHGGTSEWSQPVGDREALVTDVAKSLASVAFQSGDTVIFRSVAYDNAAELTNTVRFSNF
jgi:hypothetical protein